MLVEFLLVSVLIVISSVLTAVELAILSVNLNKVNTKVEEGDKKAKLIMEIIEKPDIFIFTLAMFRITIWIFLGMYTSQAFMEPLIRLLFQNNIFYDNRLEYIALIIIVVILSFLILILGEVVPKKIAINNPEKIAYLAVRPIVIFSKIFKPFVAMISASSKVILKILGVKAEREKENVTEEEIRMLIDVGGEVGNIAADEMEMINNVFEFNDKTVEEIATHRTDIVSLNIKDDLQKVLFIVANERYSRIPVYENNIDNVIGILHIKDVMKHIVSGINLSEENVDIRGIIRKPYFVPTSKKADELFEEMRNNKIQISVVIDEYGGTVGIVTMEDLIEEIMGNIFDEYDDEEVLEINELDDNTFIINGTADLEEVSTHLNISLPVDEYDTIGGFIIGQLGRIPNDDEQPEIQFENLIFKVKSMYEKRIQEIIVNTKNSEH